MQKLDEQVMYSVLHQPWIDRFAESLQGLVKRIFESTEVGRRTRDFLNGVWLGHPLHPSATDVPVGSWTTALILDAIDSTGAADLKGASAAAIGIGIGGAVVSAASGAADWTETEGAQRRVGLVHALLNTMALGLYGVSFWRRVTGRPAGAKSLSTLAYPMVFVSAYLGGELVYRLGTQVDRNAWTKRLAKFTSVMKAADLPEDQPKRVDANGVAVMLIRHSGMVYAMNDTCSHAGCSLAEGQLHDGEITCPCHRSTYRIQDGIVVHGPATYPQPTYDVRVRNGQIEVRVSHALGVAE